MDAEFLGTARFEVIRRLGEGGMGRVFEVFDREWRTRLALKLLTHLSAERLLLFKNEFRALQDLRHPNLVRLGELFEREGQWFFTMELVSGCDLMRYIRRTEGSLDDDETREDPTTDISKIDPQRAVVSVDSTENFAGFDEERLRATLLQLAEGMTVLHRAAKVHRDIKPSNIMVTEQGRVVLLDFGIMADLSRPSFTEMPSMGTVAYMAPEQGMGGAIGVAADWYSVGVVLYQALTGQLPHSGLPGEILMSKQTRELPPLFELLPDAPRDLCQLCQELLRIDPSQRPTGEQIIQQLRGGRRAAGPATQTSTDQIIGRQRELKELEQAFAQTADGRQITVVIHGESGVGKSFLVRHFLESVQRTAPSSLLLRGRCYEREAVPYKALDAIIDQLSSYLMTLPAETMRALVPENAQLLARLFPVFQPLTSQYAGEGDITPKDAEGARALAFSVLRELLCRLSQKVRLVMLIDDLQWTDSDSIALLGALLCPPGPPPFLLLCTMRTSTNSSNAARELDKLLRWKGEIIHLAVEKLGEGAAQELAQRLLAKDASPAEQAATAAAIARESQGHPLFIFELVRQGPELAQRSLKLDEVLWQRIRKLDAPARKLLEILAIAGTPLPQDLAARTAALSGEEFEPTSALLRAERLVRTTGGGLQDTIESYHDRVRESVLDRLDEETRRRWHGRLALSMEEAGRQDVEALLTHWQGAGNFERALSYALRAAEQAEQALAFDRAAQFYKDVLAFDRLKESEARATEIKLAQALANAHHGTESAERYLRCAAVAEPLPAQDLKRRAAYQYLSSGHLDEGIAVLRDVLKELGLEYPETARRAMALLLWRRLHIGVRGLKFRLRPEAEIPPLDQQRIAALWAAGNGLLAFDYIRGVELRSRHLLHALRAGELHHVLLGLAAEASGAASLGRGGVARTESILKRTREFKVEDPYLQGHLLLPEATLHMQAGRWPLALSSLDQGYELFHKRCIGAGAEINGVQYMRAICLWSMGAFRELGQLVWDTLQVAETRRDLFMITNFRCFFSAALLLTQDQPEQAFAEAIEGLKDWSRQGFHVQHLNVLLTSMNSLIYRGDGAAALRRYEDAAGRLKAAFMMYVPIVRIMIHDLISRAALQVAATTPTERSSALKQAQRIAQKLRAERLPYTSALAALLEGGIAQVGGDSARARTCAEAAASDFDASNMAVHAAAARYMVGRMLDGEKGQALVSAAETALRERTIQNPARYAAMLAPGYQVP